MDEHLTPFGIILKSGLKKVGALIVAEDHLAIQAVSLFGLSFILGLAFF